MGLITWIKEKFKMLGKIKRIFWKHWNCLPWAFAGILTIASGQVKMYHFIIAWLTTLFLIWLRLPLDDR